MTEESDNPVLLLDYEPGEGDGIPSVTLGILRPSMEEREDTGDLVPSLRLQADHIDRLIAQLHQYRSMMRKV